jgi:DNA-3-methyladenine glycosylase
MLQTDFFNCDAQELAKKLLGKVLCVKQKKLWLCAQIIETEAYYLHDKASHASLGYTKKRKALFMPPGTIYMYYARGKDSLNVSAQGEGNAVLIKAGFPVGNQKMVEAMQQLNPLGELKRPLEKLCAGQTLLCRSLGLRVKEWDQQQFDPQKFYIDDRNYIPQNIIVTSRLGIAAHRDAHLPYRFIDADFVKWCSKKPN